MCACVATSYVALGVLLLVEMGGPCRAHALSHGVSACLAHVAAFVLPPGLVVVSFPGLVATLTVVRQRAMDCVEGTWGVVRPLRQSSGVAWHATPHQPRRLRPGVTRRNHEATRYHPGYHPRAVHQAGCACSSGVRLMHAVRTAPTCTAAGVAAGHSNAATRSCLCAALESGACWEVSLALCV